MIYAYIIAALAVFGSGFGLAYKLDQAEIQSLRSAIDRGNIIADNLLTSSIAQQEKNRLEQDIANTKLEAQHEHLVQVSNNYRAQLGAIRLRDPGKPHRSCSPAATADTGIHREDDADQDGLSAEATEFLWGEAGEATNAAIERNTLLAFIKDNNCGISR